MKSIFRNILIILVSALYAVPSFVLATSTSASYYLDSQFSPFTGSSSSASYNLDSSNNPVASSGSSTSYQLFGSYVLGSTGPGLITYLKDTFTEVPANTGLVNDSIVISLANDYFVKKGLPLTFGADYTVSNLPVGMTSANLSITTNTFGTRAVITLNGTAIAHASANGIANVTIAFTNAAFSGGSAVNVSNSTKSNLKVDFSDPGAGVLSTEGLFTENTILNDGSVSAVSKYVFTLVNDTFAPVLTAGGNITFANTPTGMTAVITRDSATQATVTLTGNATAHAATNTIHNFSVVFNPSAFVSTISASGANYSTMEVDFYSAPDQDGDGSLDSVESGLDGDSNGTTDEKESNVTTINNTITGQLVTVKSTSAGCRAIGNVSVATEASLPSQDAGFDFPFGLINFTLHCDARGVTTPIEIYFTGSPNITASTVFRKYYPATNTFATMPGVTVSGGVIKVVLYSVTDGSSISDTDTLTDFFISDPIGPTLSVSTSGGNGGSGGIFMAPLSPVSSPAGPVLTGFEPNVSSEFAPFVCKRYLHSYISVLPGAKNNSEDVKNVQVFLNAQEAEKLKITGVYDQETILAVKRYQVKYMDQILTPWGLTKPTGNVGRTTTAKINLTVCSANQKCPYFNMYAKKGDVSLEIVKIQDFLNIISDPIGGYPNNGIPLSKVFTAQTFEAVKKYQTIYKETVLKPWGLKNATGYWYKTTRQASNNLVNCNTGPVKLDF